MTTPDDRDSSPNTSEDFESALESLEADSPAEPAPDGGEGGGDDLLDWGPADGGDDASAAEPPAEAEPAADGGLLDFDLVDAGADAPAPSPEMPDLTEVDMDSVTLQPAKGGGKEAAEAVREPVAGAAEAPHGDELLVVAPRTGDERDQSFQAAFASAQRSPGSDEAWNHLEELADTLQRPDDVADLYRKMLDRDLAADVRPHLAQRAVQFYQVWYVDTPERLTGLLSSIVQRDPTAEWAFARLTMMFTEAGQWDELLGVYDTVLAKTEEPKKRRRLLNDAAQVAKDFAHESGRAAGYFRQLLVLEPTNTKLITSLERLFERDQRWDDLIDLWRELLPKLPVSEARATRLKIAICSLEQLQKPEHALGELAAIVSESPDDEEACRRLESILVLEDAPIEARRQALSLLRKTYEIVERPQEIIRALERALEFVEGEEQRSLRRELANRLGILGREADAMDQYGQLLLSDPADADARKQLRQLARREGRHDMHAESLVAAAETCDDSAQQVALLWDAAQIRRDELEDTDGAIELLARILETEEADPHTALSAAHQLNELLAAGERAQERLGVLERLAELEQSAAIRRHILGQAARLADELGDADRALANWKPVLDEEHPDPEALAAVIDLLERHERWQELCEVLGRRATTTAMPLQRRADRTRMAEIHAEQLDDRPAAIESWQAIREEFGVDAEITSALSALLRAEGRWDALAELLREAAQVRRRNAAELLNQLGGVHRGELDQAEQATQLFVQALGVDPANEEARAGLVALLEVEGCAGEAARALAWAYDVTDDWQKTLELVEPRLAGARDAAGRVRVLTEAARLYEERAEEPTAAVRMLARALPLEPDNLALEDHLMRLGGVTRAWMDVAQALREAAAGATESPARAAELHIREGELQERELEDFASALEAYQAAAELKPEDPDRLEAVARVGARAGHWETAARAALRAVRLRDRVDAGLIASLEAAAEQLASWRELAEAADAVVNQEADQLPNKLAAELESRLAGWYRERCDDVDAANGALRRALNHDPSDLSALNELAEIQRAEPGRHLVETLLLIDDGSEQSLDALHEAAQVALQSTAEADLQLSTLERLYRKAKNFWTGSKEATGEVSPEEAAIWALDSLVELHVGRGQSERAIELLLQGAVLPLDPTKAVELRRRAGDMLADLGQRIRAIEAYRAALQDAGDDLELIRRLAKLSEQEEDATGSVALRRREMELVDDVEQRLELRLAGARRAGALEGLTGRVELLRTNLGEQPAHPGTIDALCAVLSDRGRFAELADLLDEQAGAMEEAGQASRAAELRGRLAKLCEEHLRDAEDRAIEAYTRVVELDATNEALDALARLHLERGEPGKAAEWLERRLETAAPKERVAVLLKLARARLKAEQREPAVAVLKTAFEEAPRNAEVRKLLIRQHRRREDYKELAHTLATAAEHATDESVVLAYAREAAQIYDDRLGTPEAAVSVLRKATALAPDDRALRGHLAEGLIASGELDEAEQLLVELIKSFGRRGSKERATAHLQLARVYRGQAKADQAIAHLDVAAKMDPGNVTILRDFAELSRESGQHDRAERGFRSLLLTVRRLPPTERTKAPIGAAEVLLELSRIAADRGEGDQAAELVESALEALAEHDADAPRLQARLLEEGSHDLLLRVLDARLGYVKSPHKRSQIHADKADVFERLERADEALEGRLAAVESLPASPVLHQAAWETAERLGQVHRYTSLVESLLDKSRRDTDAHARCELLLRLGAVHEQVGSDYERAAELYAQAGETGVREVDVLRAQARLAGARGDEEAQLQMLAKLASLGAAESETRSDAMYRIAEVQLASEETLGAGIDSLAAAFEDDSRTERAATILRRATENYPMEVRLLDLYEQVARKSGDDALLMHYLERRALHPDAAPDQAREAVDRALALEDQDKAEALMLRAVEIGRSADNLAAVDWALLSLAERKKNAGDIAGAVKWLEEASEAVDPAAVFALGREVAELAAQEGGDLTLAARLYERLLEREPTSREAWQPLAEIYRRLGDIDRLERVVNETLDGLQEPSERNELRVALANGLMAAEGRTEEAVAVLQDVLADDPTHEAAHAQLAEYWERTGNAAGLIELLRRQYEAAQQTGDAAAIKVAALRLGQRLEEHEPPEAAPVYRQALGAAVDDPELLAALLGRLGPEDSTEERATLTERLLTVEPGDDPGPRALELVGLYESIGDASGAQRALELGYRLAPDHATIRERLEQRFRESGDFGGLAQMLLDAAEQREDAAGKATMLRGAAGVYRDQLSEPGRASELLGQALELAPGDTAVVIEFATTLEAGGDRDAALSKLTSALETAEQAERLGLLRTRAGMRANAGDGAGAVADLEEAFGLDPEGVAAELENALEAQRQHAIEAGDQETERVATLRCIDVMRVRGNSAGATELLAGWMERSPDDVESLRRLHELQTEAQQWEAVIATCGKLIELDSGEAVEKAALALQQAYEMLGRAEEARAGLEQAREKLPDSSTLRGALRKLYEKVGAHRELARLLIEEAHALDDVEQKTAYLRWAGQTLVMVGDVDGAVPALREVLELQPEDVGARVSLADASIVAGQFDEADQLLDEALNEFKGRKHAKEQAVFLQRKSHVARAKGDPDGQLATLQKAHQSDNKNGEIACELADLAELLEQWDVATKALRAITLIEGCRITPTQALIRQGRISLRQGDTKRAMMFARRAKRGDEADQAEIDAFIKEVEAAGG